MNSHEFQIKEKDCRLPRILQLQLARKDRIYLTNKLSSDIHTFRSGVSVGQESFRVCLSSLSPCMIFSISLPQNHTSERVRL